MNNRTRSAVAEEIGIPESTLRGWENRYGIKPSSSGGKRIYNDEITRVLETIKTLKEQNRTDETITRAVRNQVPRVVNEPPQAAAPRETSPQDDANVITAAVIGAIQENNDLAEKYARATYQIGQLEERVQGFQAQLEIKDEQMGDLREQIRLLPAPDELATLRDELEQARQDLATEHKKTWWQKFIGK